MPFFSDSAFLRRLAIACCLISLAGCGGNPATSDNGEIAETSAGDDTKSALKSVGADIGCGIASLMNKDCAKGAAVGARTVERALAWIFKSLKTADAKTVNDEYETKKIAVAKHDVKAMAFTTTVQPATEAGAATAGKTPVKADEIRVTSNTDLVGYGDRVPVVTQRYALYDEKNKLVSTQTEKLTAVDGAGRYETEATVKVPKGKNRKQYRVETTLSVDGKEYKKNAYKVTQFDDGMLYLAGAAELLKRLT